MLDWHSLTCRSGKDAVQLFFPLMFTFGEKLSKVPPAPEDYTSSSRNCLSHPVVTVYNKLTGGIGRW
jgi:hypothetical protein